MTSLLDCIICQVLATTPLQCHMCGVVFCQDCLYNFWNPSPIECIQCSGKNIVGLGQELQQVYEELLVQRQVVQNEQKPTQVKQALILAPIDVPDIQAYPCHNFLYCGQKINRGFSIEKVCGIECLLFKEINDKHPYEDHKEIRQDIIRVLETIKNRVNIDIIPIERLQNKSTPDNQHRGITQFNFSLGGQSIQIMQEKRQVQQSEEVYVFRTVLGDQGFKCGIHYWEISLMSFTENEIKLGVSKGNNFDLNTGFSDLQTGWAYYTIGQLRHGSNSQGNSYGGKTKNRGTIGVLLDMNKGILCFSLDNVFLGIAYQQSELKQGPIYPAVSMLHKAGFTYKVGIPTPAIFNSIYVNE